MLVATFGAESGWDGREIYWDEDRFVLYGHGRVGAADVMEYDRRGALVWASPDLRAWVASVARWEVQAASPAAAPGYASGGAGREPRPETHVSGGYRAAGTGASGTASGARSGFPTWAIVLIAAGAAVIVLGIVVAFVVPSFLIRTGETLTNDLIVQHGVRTLQVAVEAYAAEHGGTYPDASRVNRVDLARYVPEWPTNPYTGMPMALGPGQGNFAYRLAADGSYHIVGFGRDAKVIIDVRGGGGATY